MTSRQRSDFVIVEVKSELRYMKSLWAFLSHTVTSYCDICDVSESGQVTRLCPNWPDLIRPDLYSVGRNPTPGQATRFYQTPTRHYCVDWFLLFSFSLQIGHWIESWISSGIQTRIDQGWGSGFNKFLVTRLDA